MDRKRGYEVLTLSGGGFVQELWFGWIGGRWVFSGGQMWEGSVEARGRWLWTLEHDRHETIDGVLLPGRTRIRAPGKKRNHLIVLAYKKRQANPPWSRDTSTDPDSGGDDGGDDGGWESGDDGGWENDDGGWENAEDEGWENADEEPPAEEQPAGDEAPAEEAPAPPSGMLAAVLQAAGPTGSRPGPATTIPEVFRYLPQSALRIP